MCKKTNGNAAINYPRVASMRGFSLLELIMVMVFVGILIAVVILKFADVTTQSNQAEIDALASALTASSAKNYSLSLSGSPDAVSVSNCTDVSSALPESESMGGNTINSLVVGTHARVSCTVTHSDAVSTANFIAVGT